MGDADLLADIVEGGKKRCCGNAMAVEPKVMGGGGAY